MGLLNDCTVQEGDSLGTVAVALDAEGAIAHAVGDAVLNCPQDAVVVEGALLDILEGIHNGLLGLAALVVGVGVLLAVVVDDTADEGGIGVGAQVLLPDQLALIGGAVEQGGDLAGGELLSGGSGGTADGVLGALQVVGTGHGALGQLADYSDGVGGAFHSTGVVGVTVHTVCAFGSKIGMLGNFFNTFFCQNIFKFIIDEFYTFS